MPESKTKAKPKAKPKPATRPAEKSSGPSGGGALGRARQFAVSRGLPMPQVEVAEPAPAKKRNKKPAQET